MPQGFAARLGLATSLLIVVVCLVQSWILGQRDLERVRSYLTERGRTISESVAREAGAGVAQGKVAALQQLAEQARAQSDVAYCRFFGARGLLLLSMGKPRDTGTPLQPARDDLGATGPIPAGDGLWEFQAPVFLETRAAGPPARVGTVAVGISLVSLEALRRRTFATATLVTVLFTLVAILCAVALSRAITRPLQALARAADAIARGDFGAQVEVRSRDEVGTLARAFNAMARSLAGSRATLEAKVRELERANHLKSEFVATVSDELQKPLHAIIGYAAMLAEGGCGPVTESQADMLATIEHFSRRQLDLVTDVLDFSGLGSGRLSMDVDRFELGPLLAEMREAYEPRLAPGITLTLTATGVLPPLETDRAKLRKVVDNLLDRAVKATAAGGISVAARRADEPDAVTIEVTDSGAGIDADDLPHVFDPFHETEETGLRASGSVRLGLSIVQRLVEALGGTISVTSHLGCGTTFRVYLPCRLPGALDGVADAALDDVARGTTARTAALEPCAPDARPVPRAR